MRFILITGMLLRRATKGQLALFPAIKKLTDEIMSGATAEPFEGPLAAERTLVANAKKAGLMLAGAAGIDWDEPRIAIPAFLTIVTIPLTYSIATGLSFGLISYAVLEIATGRGRRQHWMLYLLATLFLLRFIYIAGA